MRPLRFRAATVDDASFFADVWTSVRPTAPIDPIVERYWWEHDADNWTQRRYVVLRDGRPIGVARYDHPLWQVSPERFGIVGGEVVPEERDRETLDALFAEMERRLAADGARRGAARANEDDAPRIATILARGFREDRRGRRWELDLVANRERVLAMADETRARMRAAGIRLRTLAEDPDPERYRRIWRLSEEAAHDIPTTLPHIEESLDDYLDWFRSPDMREDRFWIAREGDEIVGVSVLAYPPVRGVVGTAWTATARSVRGRGIARALKCETLAQAISLGVDRVRTGNDAQNDPILHLNATMGYRPIAGSINFLKDL